MYYRTNYFINLRSSYAVDRLRLKNHKVADMNCLNRYTKICYTAVYNNSVECSCLSYDMVDFNESTTASFEW